MSDALSAQFKQTAEDLTAFVCGYGMSTLSLNRCELELLKAYEAGLIVGQAIGPDSQTPPVVPAAPHATYELDGGIVV